MLTRRHQVNYTACFNQDGKGTTRFLRMGPRENTTLTSQVLVYELSTVSYTHGDNATAEVRTEAFVAVER